MNNYVKNYEDFIALCAQLNIISEESRTKLWFFIQNCEKKAAEESYQQAREDLL